MFGGKSKTKAAAAEAPPEVSPAVDALFNTFADSEDVDLITMDGLQAFGARLDIDPSSDIRFLVLLWKLGALSKPGCITRAEFAKGMRTMRKDSIDALKQTLPSFDPGFLERTEFRDFYKFVFQFSREGTRKSIEKDMVVALLQIVLDVNRAPHVDLFIEFLQQIPKADLLITHDQWESFLQFNNMVPVGLEDFDDDNAWPLLLEDYVAWRRTRPPGP